MKRNDRWCGRVAGVVGCGVMLGLLSGCVERRVEYVPVYRSDAMPVAQPVYAGQTLYAAPPTAVVQSPPPAPPPPPPVGNVTAPAVPTAPPAVTAPTVIAAPPAPPQPVVVNQAPPTAVVEVIPPSPGVEFYWVPGYWHWQGSTYIWIGGAWARRPWHHAVWVGGGWHRHGRSWVWVGGRWR